MKPKNLKLKCLLLTNDGGETWQVIRQLYATDLVTNAFLDDSFQGMLLKTVEMPEGKLCKLQDQTK